MMITARASVMRVTPPMKAPAPISANAPGSIHAQGLGGRKTPGGALRRERGGGRCTWRGVNGMMLGLGRERHGCPAERKGRLTGGMSSPQAQPKAQAQAQAQAATACPHPWEPAPCAAAMSTPTSPTSRPMQAPMSSMGTNTPEEMAEPAAHKGSQRRKGQTACKRATCTAPGLGSAKRPADVRNAWQHTMACRLAVPSPAAAGLPLDLAACCALLSKRCIFPLLLPSATHTNTTDGRSAHPSRQPPGSRRPA